MTDYAFIQWRDENGRRAYVHPWCARWSVVKDGGTEVPSSMACRNCGHTLPLRRDPAERSIA